MIRNVMLAICLTLSLAGCKTVIGTDGVEKRVVDIAKIQRYSDAVVPILRVSAAQAALMPDFDKAKKEDLDKAMLSLEASYVAIKALPPESTNAGLIVSAFASSAQVVVPMLNLKPEQKIYITTALSIIQLAAPLVVEIGS